jgi:hypothetical protein
MEYVVEPTVLTFYTILRQVPQRDPCDSIRYSELEIGIGIARQYILLASLAPAPAKLSDAPLNGMRLRP